MIKTEPMDTEALQRRIAELESENRDLRARLSDPGAGDGLGPASERTDEMRFRQIADHLPALIAYVDASQRYRFNNRAYETWVGKTPESLYGAHLRDAIGPAAYERVKPLVEAALAGERTLHEWWAPFPTGLRYLKSEYIPDPRADGSIAGFFVLASDLTETKRSREALAESEARLRLAIDAGRMAVWEVQVPADAVTASPELNRLFGLAPDAVLSLETLRACYRPGERERLHAAVTEAIARGDRHVETELQVMWPDGSLHWLLLRAELEDVRDGVPARTFGVALDITDMKRAEAHRELLINELNHRVKNTLATVQSIASQSLRNALTAEEARSAIEGRLFALSRAHDVLTRENWDGAYLRELVREAIAPFQPAGQSRFDVQGPDVRLPPRIALALAMALQELGTNAVKYGALSDPMGHVAVEWSVTRRAGDSRLELTWTERDGPPVPVPSHRGFGTRLIERSLAQELDGDVSIAFEPAGIVCRIDAPLGDTAA